jgi:signal transduction histidine kinase
LREERIAVHIRWMGSTPTSAASTGDRSPSEDEIPRPEPVAPAARNARPRLEELQRLTSALVRLSTFEDIGAFCSRELADLAGASMCWIGRVTDDGTALESIGSHGVSQDTAHRFSRLRIEPSYAIGEALISGRPLWFVDRTSLLAAFPALAVTARDIDREGAAFIPLLVGDGSGGRRVGGLSLGFRAGQVPVGDARDFVLSLAQQCALALDRARLHEAERIARRDAEAAKQRAERAAYRAGRLLHLASSLSRALTREDVAAVILDEAMPAFHASGAWIVHAGSSSPFDILGMRGVREELIRPLARAGRQSRSLSAEVARTGEARFLIVGSRDEWSRLYPDSAEFVASHHFGVLAALPLRYGGATHGVLAFGLPAVELAEEDRAAMMAFAAQCSQSLERARLHAAERAARQAAEHAANRTARLQALTSSLSQALTLGEICDIIAREGRAALEASAVAVFLLDDARAALELVEDVGFSELSRQRFTRVPLATDLPMTEAVRTEQPMYFTSQDELSSRYPLLADVLARSALQTLAVVPLRASVEVMGVLVLAFAAPSAFEQSDRAFAEALATQCAQAMERAELAAERAKLSEARSWAARRAGFLADASRALAIPLDGDEVLHALAALPVPAFADYTIVYRIGSDGLIHRVARAHADAGRARVLDTLEREYPLRPGSDVLASRVMRTRERLLIPHMSMDALRDAAPDARYLEIVAELGPCSGIVVPLTARGRALGALVLAMADPACGGSGRRFTEDDLALAESLAERAALALDSLLVLAEAERARAESEHANRAKSDFLATMSHELRTPLNAIAGFVQLLDMELHGPVTAAQRDSLARIGRAQERLLGLINDILNFARLEAGRVEYDIRPTHVGEVVTEVSSLMESQLSARALELDIALPEHAGEAPIVVQADRDKLAQVLLNLLSNAVKFTAPGGRIGIELGPHPRDDTRVELRVTDTGTGIPSEKLQTIFEPFVQLGRGLTSNAEGTGLGLAISRDLVRGMDGELAAESTPGAGSTFRIELLRA